MDKEGFQTARETSRRKYNESQRRLYIGNMRPESCALDERLSKKFAESGIRLSEVKIVRNNKTCFALAMCSDIQRAVQLFHGMEFEGKRLTVEKEKKKSAKRTGDKRLFGATGWSKPKASTMETTRNIISSGATLECDEPSNGDEVVDDDFDFLQRRNHPLVQLLQDYGEQDLDFTVAKVTNVEESSGLHGSAGNPSRLGQHGKASIHIMFSSFGYEHGAPCRRRGWSQAEPLPPLDCRVLPPVPTFLAKFDGLAPRVKREIHTTECRDVAMSLATRTLEAVIDAIDSGYGPAQPLRMSVFVGSDAGRHRSVVVCESAAQSLRTALRLNQGTRVLEFVSVGTHHSNIATKKQDRRSREDEDDKW